MGRAFQVRYCLAGWSDDKDGNMAVVDRAVSSSWDVGLSVMVGAEYLLGWENLVWNGERGL